MGKQQLRSTLLILVASALVTACGPDGGVSVPRKPAEQPSDPSPPPPAQNRAPTISGNPALTGRVGVPYSFAPTASDADGDALVWSISGKPASATFNTSTGALTWTPDQAGTWPGIVITVTDARGASATLAPFTLSIVEAAQLGSASLSWTSPTSYTDGSALPASELGAYRIYSGTSRSSLAPIAEVDSRTTSFTARNLPQGTHYFAVTAITASGMESSLSAIGSKTIL
jgi:hypothetical protein